MVLCKMLHLLVRDVSNRWQKYEKAFKLPKNYGIIFEKQTKLLIWVNLSCFPKCDTNVERKKGYTSFLVDNMNVMLPDTSLTKR